MVAASKPPERGYNPELPSGYDVRDVLTADSRGLGDRIRALQGLLVAIQPIPSEALRGPQGASGSSNPGEVGLECTPCSKYKIVQTAWRKALKWTDGLDHGLAVMLASVASTKTVGDQLWIKVIGPAACLHGNTLIYDPTDRTMVCIAERERVGKEFTVLSREENGTIIVAKAMPPQRSVETVQMYEVQFDKTEPIQVTADHQFWTGRKYQTVRDIDSLLQTVGDWVVSKCSWELVGGHITESINWVTSIKPTTMDYYYDFHVPVTNNYWACGLIHHNCGKSTLAEALSVNKEYVIAKSTIRGFHSGYKMDGKSGGGGEDHSLIPQIRDKTLVTKDGDTLLQSPNLPQILSEARDLYDCTARTHYRNAMSKDYSGIRMTWLLYGTSSLRLIDNSELGERFLDCVIMEKIDDDLEDEVLWRVANRAERNVAIESDGDAKSQYEPELAEAMSLTGGYVGWLRENAADGMSAIETPVWAIRRCTRLGKFVAHMRARPSVHQEENAEREFSARLVSQLVRLAKCLALVLNRDRVDATVMQRVTRVALDTSRGQTLAIVAHLYDEPEGLEVKGIVLKMAFTEHRIRSLLRFLKQIDVVNKFQVKRKGFSSAVRWGLTQRMRELYELVVEKSVG